MTRHRAWFFMVSVILLSVACSTSGNSVENSGDGDGSEEESIVENDLDADLDSTETEESETLEPDGDSGSEEGDEIADFEEAEFDGDLSDGDREEVEVEEDPWDASGLPNCEESDEVPCRLDGYPFEWIDAYGTFRIGPAGNESLNIGGLWKNYLGFSASNFSRNGNDVFGMALYNLKKKETVLLSYSGAAYWNGFGDGLAVFLENQPTSDENDDIDFVYSTSIENFERQLVSDSETPKVSPYTYGGKIYWLDQRYGQANTHIFWVNEDGAEEQIDSMAEYGIAGYDAFNETMIYMSGDLYLINLTTQENQMLPNSQIVWDIWGGPHIWNQKIYWSDYRLDEDVHSGCGLSVIEHNMENNEEKVLVPFDQGDLEVTDVWEDWLVYTDYSEGGGDSGLEQCFWSGANSDVYLMYIPTGEKWNLTDAPGRQDMAHIWGRWVIWRDERDDPTGYEYVQDLYGRDLCLHPDLKSRIPGCD